MSLKVMRLIMITLIAVNISGCASFLTRTGPVVSELVDGEKSMGGFAEYKYSGDIRSNKIFLDKTPMCSEIVEKLRIAQKPRRGFGPAMLEMVFFGLGFFDLARARAISEESKKIYPVATYETSNRLVCGDKQPASNELLVFEDKQRTFQRKASTKADGTLDLDVLLDDVNRPLNLKIRRAADDTVYVSYLYIPKEK